MDKFKNKYRISSHRKPNWDYSADALYFLTIVTQNRECNLGKIVNKKMILSDFGKIVEFEWFKSFEIRKELILHDFIIMPNHLHTIVEIFNGSSDPAVELHGRASLRFDSTDPTEPIDVTERIDSIDSKILSIKRNPPIRIPKSISSFVAGFKSAVNTKIDDFIDEQNLSQPKYNRNNHFFQPNYHDHIIRNQCEYQNISNYIRNNPLNWNNDSFNC
ncbi:transposase [Lacihabitans sp. LS3-19]|uniref:transposase n=1 Tax=Lacihabitans sp. LS3-19 TaxID=2487335 RepID=UPI0020CBF787|nr:transposase [Lacihabitans sp. LS3-19]